jgi:hypothetical protein
LGYADPQAEKLKNYDGDKSKLAKPDQFFLDVRLSITDMGEELILDCGYTTPKTAY